MGNFQQRNGNNKKSTKENIKNERVTKNTFNWFIHRLKTAEERISELKDETREIIQNKVTKSKKTEKNIQSIQDLQEKY